LLLNINIIVFKQIIVNFDIKQLTLNSYRRLTISLNVTTQNNTKICKVLKLKYRIIIDTNSIVKISIRINQSLLNCNFLFELNLIDIYTHVIDILLFTIYIRNKSFLSIVVYKSTNFDCLIKFKKQNCY